MGLFGPRLRKPEVVAKQAIGMLRGQGLPEVFTVSAANFERILTIYGSFAQEKGVPNGAREIVSLVEPAE